MTTGEGMPKPSWEQRVTERFRLHVVEVVDAALTKVNGHELSTWLLAYAATVYLREGGAPGQLRRVCEAIIYAEEQRHQ